MLCPNCAAQLSDTAKFCSNCGTSVVAQTASPYAAADAAASAPYQQQTAQQAAQPEPSAFERGYQQGYAWASGESQPNQQANTAWADPSAPTGQQYDYNQTYAQPAAPTYAAPAASPKNHVVAGLLALFLGALGIHKFYLGYNREGVIMLLVTLLGSLLTFGIAAAVMEVIAFIEAIIYFVKSDEDFYYTYELGNKPWF